MKLAACLLFFQVEIVVLTCNSTSEINSILLHALMDLEAMSFVLSWPCHGTSDQLLAQTLLKLYSLYYVWMQAVLALHCATQPRTAFLHCVKDATLCYTTPTPRLHTKLAVKLAATAL